jgi:hypothetical protein
MIFHESGQIVRCDLLVGEKYKDFLQVVKLFQATCLLVKNTKNFQKWFNCSKRSARWWKINEDFLEAV